MANFPEIHPEKCPYCGSELKLFTGKYLWDYYYECKNCYPFRRFHFKNEAMPSMKDVRESEEYKNWKSIKEAQSSEATASYAFPMSSASFASASTPAKHPSLVTYVCKEFYGTTEGNVHRTPEENLERYLNTYRIDPNRIIAITSRVHVGPYGGSPHITLVHY